MQSLALNDITHAERVSVLYSRVVFASALVLARGFTSLLGRWKFKLKRILLPVAIGFQFSITLVYI